MVWKRAVLYALFVARGKTELCEKDRDVLHAPVKVSKPYTGAASGPQCSLLQLAANVMLPPAFTPVAPLTTDAIQGTSQPLNEGQNVRITHPNHNMAIKMCQKLICRRESRLQGSVTSNTSHSAGSQYAETLSTCHSPGSQSRQEIQNSDTSEK